MAMICSERVFKLIDTEAEYEEDRGREEILLQGNINFYNINFSYKEGSPVLKDIDFSIKAGEKLAIVGTTGSGKSTLTALISRLYEPDSGKISIDGTEIKDIPFRILRKQIVWVPQDVFLFPGSVYDNIIMGDQSISREKVMDAVDRIGAREFIERLPGGLDFKVNERGVLLSAGQRQMISFLRAGIVDPRILILDEATANIDPESEKFITRATMEVTHGRTAIIIAHRLQTILQADRIMVLEQGKIKEMGSFDELMKKEGRFAELYRAQTLTTGSNS
jgi:ATP-binding cassette subfamily B protein